MKVTKRGRDMEKKALLICSAIGFLGILSAGAGFAAEATRIKGSSVQLIAPTQCAYPRSPAMALGLTAAVALVIAQIIISWSTCSNKSSHLSISDWAIALGCFTVSWFTFAVAFFLLVTAAAMNERHGEDSSDLGSYYCYVVKPGVFAGGAALSIVSISLGILYYLTLTSPWDDDAAGGVAASELPTRRSRDQDPVFVHEDTYMRRQFA